MSAEDRDDNLTKVARVRRRQVPPTVSLRDDPPGEQDGEPSAPAMSRRELLELGAVVGAAFLAGAEAAAEAAPASTGPLAPMPALGGAPDEILRMQAEVRRALQKPVEQRSWIMVIDTRKCTGCQACVVACATENVLPPGVTYRSVPEVENGDYPRVKRIPMPTQCMQCDKPPCVAAANAVAPGSMTKRPDGIVAVDYARFRGKSAFRAAAKACPYRGLYYDDGKFYTQPTPAFQPYERAVSHDWGRRWLRERYNTGAPVGGGRKCHFCLHRLEAGMVPVCVSTCIGRAVYFGDKNDSHSLVNELLTKNAGQVVRIRDNRGTEPRVYYLCDDPQESNKYHD
ncbi:MAG: 4Fe-4S dicluster domain-containing protein [Armatimonadetes bacterium]|nr:4Fe-4S dicluster domain-containing protein [Armatimonadota bacterium]